MKAETFAGLSTATSERVLVNDIMSVRESALHMIDGFHSHTRAYLQIQNGCDHRCTFCIIPFGRGPSRSVPAGEVVTQVRALVERDTCEVVLTGVDITSYGRDLPGGADARQARAAGVEACAGTRAAQLVVDRSSRSRCRSDDRAQRRGAADAAFAFVAAGGRRSDVEAHEAAAFARRCDCFLRESARRSRPDIVFGADLIAGFPTETDDMFENSLTDRR